MAEFGISRTTVRRALGVLARAGLLQALAGRGSIVHGQVPPAPAAEGGIRAILLVVPTFSDPFYGELVDAIEQEARRHGLSVIAGQSDYCVESESRQLAAAASDPVVRAVVVVPSSVAAPSPGAQALAATGKPLVYLGRWPADGSGADSIGTDYREAAFQATRHLLARGDHRIAYVEGRPHLPGFSPRAGYAAALLEAGIAAPDELVRILDLPAEEAGARGVAAMIAAGIPFSAVLARNDVTAMGVLRALREAGLAVPGDVAVASINNSVLARSVDPPLTSVDTFPHVVGRMAVRLVQDRLDRVTTGPAVHLTVGSALIVRPSTATAPAARRRQTAQFA